MNDLISRQAAIEAVKSYWKNEVDRIPKKSTDFDVFTQICDSILTHNANICKAIDKLPSAQPETHEKRTETHACDLISRQWLMECIDEGWIKFDTEKDANTYIHLVRDIAPSAQPEHTMRCKYCDMSICTLEDKPCSGKVMMKE